MCANHNVACVTERWTADLRFSEFCHTKWQEIFRCAQYSISKLVVEVLEVRYT